MTLLEEAFYGAAWDESEHPRDPAGVKTGGQFRALYHVSPVSNRQAIREQGLLAEAPKRYTDSGPGVYAFGSKDEAWRFLTTGERMYGAQDIWEIRNDDLTLEPDPFFEPGHPLAERAIAQMGEKPSAFVTRGNILPDALTLHPDPWHPDPETTHRLVSQGLQSWVGDPASMRIHMAAELGDPDATPYEDLAGSGKQMRDEASALLQAVREGGANTKRLYRGAVSVDPGELGIPQSWTESRAVAKKFAGKTGTVHVLEPGTARGIRMRDYISSGMDLNKEKQWLIDPWSFNQTASGYGPSVTSSAWGFVSDGWDESEHPRWGKGHSDGGKFRSKAAGSSFELPEEMNAKMPRVQVKVGRATNLREEIRGWYEVKVGEGVNGRPIYGLPPEWQSIMDNWGNWTTEELYKLRGELEKQLREKGQVTPSGWQPSGLLSNEYAREIGRSLSQAKNEGKRLYEAVDKALTIEQFGYERAVELYPELFEKKAPKAKQPDPRDQGIPDVYLSESGKFKPGYDAKLKSDLVNSALGMNPRKMEVRTISKEVSIETQGRVADWWKERNADEYARQGWSDAEIFRMAKYDPLMPRDLANEVMVEEGRKSTRELKSTLLHRFEPEHAIRILEERGWTSQLDKARGKHGLLIREPSRDDVVAREVLEKPYASATGNPGVTITGWNIGRVQEMVGEAAEIPEGIHRQLYDKGVSLYFGPPESTDLNEMWHIRDERARNGDSRTMKAVAGFYSPSTRKVIISADSRYGSAGLATHEVGHAIGHVLDVDRSVGLARWHKTLKDQNMLGSYYLQNGNDFDGGQELWAEGVALHYRDQRYDRLGRDKTIYQPRGPFKTAEHLQKDSAKAYMDWVARTLRELERGGQIPES